MNPTLLKVVLFGGMPLIFGAVYYANGGARATPSALRLPHCQESVHLLKGYQPAMDKLGEPLTIESIDAKDAFNKTEGNRLQVKLPITGKTRAADLFIYADKLSDEDRNWSVNKLEIKYAGSINTYKFFDRSLIGTKTQ